MKIDLKNIQYSEKLSEETYAFSANLYIEGKMVGIASNRGRGGSTDYSAIDGGGRKLISDAEIFCKGLPPVKFNSDGKDSFLNMDLECYIDQLLDKYLEEKDKKKFQTRILVDMKKGIIVGIPDKSYILWKFNMPMEEILENPKGPDLLKKVIKNDIVPTLTDKKIILNDNIPHNIFKEAGLKESQYAKELHEKNIAGTHKKKSGRKL